MIVHDLHIFLYILYTYTHGKSHKNLMKNHHKIPFNHHIPMVFLWFSMVFHIFRPRTPPPSRPSSALHFSTATWTPPVTCCATPWRDRRRRCRRRRGLSQGGYVVPGGWNPKVSRWIVLTMVIHGYIMLYLP